MTISEVKTSKNKMTGKLRTIGITLFSLIEILKYNGVDLGVNQDEVYRGLELITGAIAGVGAVISWWKLIYRNINKNK